MANQILVTEGRGVQIDVEINRRVSEGMEPHGRSRRRAVRRIERRVETGQYVPRDLQRYPLHFVEVAVIGDAHRHSKRHILDAGLRRFAHIVIRNDRRCELIVRHDDDVVRDGMDFREPPCDVDNLPFRAALEADVVADTDLLRQENVQSFL